MRAEQPIRSQPLAQANWRATEDPDSDAEEGICTVVGIRRWNKEWASLAMDLAQDRRAWSAAIRDAVDAMDALAI